MNYANRFAEGLGVLKNADVIREITSLLGCTWQIANTIKKLAERSNDVYQIVGRRRMSSQEARRVVEQAQERMLRYVRAAHLGRDEDRGPDAVASETQSAEGLEDDQARERGRISVSARLLPELPSGGAVRGRFRVKALDLFCGAGGASRGLANAGVARDPK